MAERRLHGLQRVLGVNVLYRQLPDTMRRLHRRCRTPYIGIVVFAGFACIALLPGQADFELPPLAAVGLTGTALSFVVVSVPDLKVAIAGVTWMALGMGGYVISRRSQGLDLASTHQIAPPQPATQTGRLIVDESGVMRAHALGIPLPPRTGTTLFGKTVETVLADRPRRVIIEPEPTHA